MYTSKILNRFLRFQLLCRQQVFSGYAQVVESPLASDLLLLFSPPPSNMAVRVRVLVRTYVCIHVCTVSVPVPLHVCLCPCCACGYAMRYRCVTGELSPTDDTFARAPSEMSGKGSNIALGPTLPSASDVDEEAMGKEVCVCIGVRVRVGETTAHAVNFLQVLCMRERNLGVPR